MEEIAFDQKSGVKHPADDLLSKGLIARQDSIIELAKRVREDERKLLNPHDDWMGNPCPYPFVYGAFSWYAASLIAYLRLLRLVEALRRDPSAIDRVTEDRDRIKREGNSYLQEVCPTIKLWRDKVGAHAAISDPRENDNLAVLYGSVSYPVTAKEGRFFVGDHIITVKRHGAVRATHASEAWSVTESFEELASRFWPQVTL